MENRLTEGVTCPAQLIPAQPTPSAATKLPVIVHPTPLPLDKIPTHWIIPSVQGTDYPDIQTFVQATLDEALELIDTRVPPHGVTPKKYHPRGSNAKVYLTHEVLTAQANHLRQGWQNPVDHAWYTRCSRHDDRVRKGTANYREFVSFLKKNHAGNMRNRHRRALDGPASVAEWDCRNYRFQHGWRNVTARFNIITESHHIGPSRTYTVLEITAARRIIDPDNDPEANRPELEAGRPLTFYVDPPRQPPLEVDQELESDAEPPRECFMVVQLPIDHRPMYNTINTPVRNVYGSYVSVQYVAQLEPPQVAAGEKPPMPQLEWKMAISANPGQLLHFFLMKNWKIGLPRLLVSDVGKFFDFVHKKREGDHRARPAPRRRRLVRRGFRITITEVYDDDDD